MYGLTRSTTQKISLRRLQASCAWINGGATNLSDRGYAAPSLPFHDRGSSKNNMSLGYRKEDFLLDLDKWTFLDHGAFGAALNVGYERAASWRNYLERQPRSYLERELLPHMAHSTRLLADFMKTPSTKELTLLPNVTAGMNALLSGHIKTYGKENAHIVLWDNMHDSVKKMVQHYYKASHITEIPFEAKYLEKLASASEPESIFLEALDDSMSVNKGQLEGKKILFCLDHTSSAMGLTLPIAQLSKHIKQKYNYNKHDDAIVVVDGVQALLARNVNLTNLFQEAGVDVYLTNGHKWLSAPRGLGILAAQQKWYETILRDLDSVSIGKDNNDLFSRFMWDEARDYSAALSLPAVLDYWNSRNKHGLTVLRYDMRRAVKESIRTLAKHWHPSDYHQDETAWAGRVTLANMESSLVSQMPFVALPLETFGNNKTAADARRVQEYLYYQNIEVPVLCINGKLYVRTSQQVYNTPEDCKTLANAVLEMK